jgi:hypothetical protein
VEKENGREEWPALFLETEKGIWRIRNAHRCRAQGLPSFQSRLRDQGLKDPGKAGPIAREQVFFID